MAPTPARSRLSAVGIVVLLLLTACANRKHDGAPGRANLPFSMPGAYGRLPPTPQVRPTPIPPTLLITHIDRVERRGAHVYVEWVAPGATDATVQCSNDGSVFETLVAHTGELRATITPPLLHGVIRVLTRGGGRSGSDEVTF